MSISFNDAAHNFQIFAENSHKSNQLLVRGDRVYTQPKVTGLISLIHRIGREFLAMCGYYQRPSSDELASLKERTVKVITNHSEVQGCFERGMNERIVQLQANVAALKEQTEAEKSRLQQSLHGLQGELTAAKAEIAAAQALTPNQIAQQQRELENLRREALTVRARITEMQAQVSELGEQRRELDSLRTQAEALRNTDHFKELKNQLAQARARYNTAAEIKAILDLNLERLKSENSRLASDLRNAQTEITLLHELRGYAQDVIIHLPVERQRLFSDRFGVRMPVVPHRAPASVRREPVPVRAPVSHVLPQGNVVPGSGRHSRRR